MPKIQDELSQRYLEDLTRLIAIPSYPTKPLPGAPFGQGIKDAMAELRNIAERSGLKVVNHDGYAMDIRTSDEVPYLGLLCHIDTVEPRPQDYEAWATPPLTLSEKEGVLYGLGVNDDKGPLLAALYAVEIFSKKRKGKHRPIRLIVGGAEETSWAGIKHYFSKEPQPLVGFSPDGDFPLVNGEKGILQLRFVWPKEESPSFHLEGVYEPGFMLSRIKLDEPKGKGQSLWDGVSAMSRHPERGRTPLNEVLKHLETQGYALPAPLLLARTLFSPTAEDVFSLKKEDPAMGSSSMALTDLKSGLQSTVAIDLRYTRTNCRDDLIRVAKTLAKDFAAELVIEGDRRLLYHDASTPWIQALLAAYREETGDEGEVICKGGASYARALERGVAFGPGFPGENPLCHRPNEHMPLASLMQAMRIWIRALEKLEALAIEDLFQTSREN